MGKIIKNPKKRNSKEVFIKIRNIGKIKKMKSGKMKIKSPILHLTFAIQPYV